MKPLALSRSYSAGSDNFDTLEFRSPTFSDYRKIGPVVEAQQGYVVVDREAVFGYAETLLKSPQPGALNALDLPDVLALEDHILSFFIEAKASISARANSSLGSDGTPAASTP